MTVSALSCLVAPKKDVTGSVCTFVHVHRPPCVVAELIFSSRGTFLYVNLPLSAVHIWPFKEENFVRKSLTENREMD